MSDNPYESPKCYDNTRDMVDEFERLVTIAIDALIDFTCTAFWVVWFLLGLAGGVDILLRLLF